MSRKIPILIPRGKKVILFDGVCNVCDGFVQFILKRDKRGLFYFASLQSDIAQQLLAKHKITIKELSTVVLIDQDNDKTYTHSDVPLIVAKDLGGMCAIFYLFRILPKGLRDRFYNWFAENRYRLFGKKEVCMLPQPEWHSRFLDVI